MTRTGPNQDINDPTTIVQLDYEYQEKSKLIGDLLAIYNSQNIDATGPPIVDISIPLKIWDGSTQFLHGNDISYNGRYIYDETLVSNATLITYIDLAERFRDYFETLRNVLISLDSVESIDTTNVSQRLPGSETIRGYITATSGSYGGKVFDVDTINFNTLIPDVPAWLGEGPTNYNYNTYPQLIDINNAMSGSAYESRITMPEIYYWDQHEGSRRVGGTTANYSFFAGSSFDSSSGNAYTPLQSLPGQFIEIPNISDSSEQTISLGATSSYDRNVTGGLATFYFATESVFIGVVSGIGNWGNPGSANIGSTFVTEGRHDDYINISGSYSLDVSFSKNVNIPPRKSLFFYIYAKSLASFGADPNKSVVLNGSTSVSVGGGNVSVPSVNASESFSFIIP
jgi:hypothetical protein